MFKDNTTPPTMPSDAKRKSKSATEQQLLSAADAAILLGISQSHFFNLVKTGQMGPSPIRLGRSVRYFRNELLAWAASGSPDKEVWQSIRAVSMRENMALAS